MIALLRGINVGGRNKVPMAELRQLFEDLGHLEVRSLIQSGNVVFEAADSEQDERQLAADLAAAIHGRFEVHSPVLVRSAEELSAALADNPFFHPDRSPANQHVVFLDHAPDGHLVKELDPHRSPPDEFAVVGRHLFWWFPNGSARSKFSLDYFERVLDVTGTARNLRTVGKILELAQPSKHEGRQAG